MNRPELSPDAAESLYAFYEQLARDHSEAERRPGLRTIAYLASLTCSPVVEVSPEVSEQLHDDLAKPQGLIVALNHISIRDFLTVGSLVHRHPDINAISNKFFVLAKVGLFKSPVARLMSEQISAIPVFRYKDRESRSVKRQDAIEIMESTSARLIQDGLSMVIFPEGTFRPKELGPIRDSIGRIAVAAQSATAEPVKILPIGIQHKATFPHKTFVSIGEPFQAGKTVDEVLENTRLNLEYQRGIASDLALESVAHHQPL